MGSGDVYKRQKQYQFRAGTNIDLRYYQAFKTYMKHVFIPRHKGILSEDELRRVQEDVDKAKREDFLIRDPDTHEMALYNLETLHRLSIAIRDAWHPIFGTYYIGNEPDRVSEMIEDDDYEHLWYRDILDGKI